MTGVSSGAKLRRKTAAERLHALVCAGGAGANSHVAMPDSVKIRLEPLGETLHVGRGTPLRDVLFSYGVEFPCGGRGHCARCVVKVLQGQSPATSDEERILGPEELREGWRLACRQSVESAITLEVGRKEASILADWSDFEFTPSEGLGVAVDLGSTTLVAQLLDLASGGILAVRTGLNPQVAYGSDVISRVDFALSRQGLVKLCDLIRGKVGSLVSGLLVASGKEREGIRKIVIVGNTVMHHLFCGLNVEALSQVPFESPRLGEERFRGQDLGWRLAGDPTVSFLSCLGGFVGSDILAGALAVRMHESAKLIGLIDLGTNGEILIGNRDRMVCASTAAGPAFEGGRIAMGMRAETGAIHEVSVAGAELVCRVLGGGTARGMCGSGLVDAVAAGLNLGLIESNGRFAQEQSQLLLEPPVRLLQRDVRELQLAKAAIAAGVKILLSHLGAALGDVERLYLAGAFGNYVERASARRIGLLKFSESQVEAAGNTALLGAKRALFSSDANAEIACVLARTEHLPLAAHPRFQDVYVEEMLFPSAA